MLEPSRCVKNYSFERRNKYVPLFWMTLYNALKSVMGPGRAGSGREYSDFSFKRKRTHCARCARSLVNIITQFTTQFVPSSCYGWRRLFDLTLRSWGLTFALIWVLSGSSCGGGRSLLTLSCVTIPDVVHWVKRIYSSFFSSSNPLKCIAEVVTCKQCKCSYEKCTISFI